MSRMKPLKPGEKVGLKVTLAERTLLLNVMHDLPDKIADVIRNTPTVQPIMLTFNDLDDLHGNVSAVADRTKDKKLQEQLDAISEKIQNTLYRCHEEPQETDRPDTISFLDRFVEYLGQPGPRIVPLPTKSNRGEDQYGLKLTDKQRESLINCTELSKGLRGRSSRLTQGHRRSGSPETNSTNSPVRSILPSMKHGPRTRSGSRAVYLKLESLLDALEDDEANEPRQPIAHRNGIIYQFKVTLRSSKPPIWRRFQVPDCTLGELHEVLQVVMDWGNSHLHQFIIRGECFGPVDSEDSLRNGNS